MPGISQRIGRWVFERNGNAVASLLFAVAGLLALGVILGPIAVGLGLLARSQIRAADHHIDRRGVGAANAGIAIGVLAFVLPILQVLT